MVKQCFWQYGALVLLLAQPASSAWAQAVPNAGERVESLITFGAQSDTK